MYSAPKNDFATYESLHGILHIRFKKDRRLNLAAAKRIVDDRIIWQNGLAYPIICDIREIPTVDKPVKDYFATQGSHLITALAFLVSNYLDFSMYRYYISFQQGKIPSRAYCTMEEAVASAKGYVGPGPHTGPNPENETQCL